MTSSPSFVIFHTVPPKRCPDTCGAITIPSPLSAEKRLLREYSWLAEHTEVVYINMISLTFKKVVLWVFQPDDILECSIYIIQSEQVKVCNLLRKRHQKLVRVLHERWRVRNDNVGGRLFGEVPTQLTRRICVLETHMVRQAQAVTNYNNGRKRSLPIEIGNNHTSSKVQA
jgi:hypothetical protein